MSSITSVMIERNGNENMKIDFYPSSQGQPETFYASYNIIPKDSPETLGHGPFFINAEQINVIGHGKIGNLTIEKQNEIIDLVGRVNTLVVPESTDVRSISRLSITLPQ